MQNAGKWKTSKTMQSENAMWKHTIRFYAVVITEAKQDGYKLWIRKWQTNQKPMAVVILVPNGLQLTAEMKIEIYNKNCKSIENANNIRISFPRTWKIGPNKTSTKETKYFEIFQDG